MLWYLTIAIVLIPLWIILLPCFLVAWIVDWIEERANEVPVDEEHT